MSILGKDEDLTDPTPRDQRPSVVM